MKEICYTVPATETSKVTRTIVKPLSECTPDEVLLAYKQHVPQDFEVPEEQRAINELYEIPIEVLLERAQIEKKQADAQELLQFRTGTAATFFASNPVYQQTIKNAGSDWRPIAQKILDELDRQNLRGTVTDYNAVFEHLVGTGQIKAAQPAPQPKTVYTEAQLRDMPIDQLEAVTNQALRDGIF